MREGFLPIGPHLKLVQINSILAIVMFVYLNF